jgi:hypothetical protein
MFRAGVSLNVSGPAETEVAELIFTPGSATLARPSQGLWANPPEANTNIDESERIAR